MKKLVIAVIVIIAFILLVVPGAVGFVAENEFRKVAANIETDAPGFQWIVEDYKRGWFTSRARYRLGIKHPAILEAIQEGEDEDLQIPTLVNEASIYHGPIALAAIGQPGVSLLPMIAHSVDSLAVTSFEGNFIEVPGTFSTRLRFSGRHLATVDVQPMRHAFEEDGQSVTLNWEGMRLDAVFNSELDRIAMRGNIGPVSLNGEAFEFSSGEMQIESDSRRSEFGIWTGDGRLEWQGMGGHGAGASSLRVGRMVMEVTSAIDEGMFGQDFVLTLDSVEADDWKGGPARLSMELGRLDASAIRSISDRVREASMRASGTDTHAGMMFELMQPLQVLLAGGPHLNLRELSLGTPQGPITLSAELIFPESSPAEAAAFFLGLSGEARFRMPAALMQHAGELNEEAGAQARQLMEAGFLMQDDGYLYMDAALKGGLFTVNGQPLPLPLGTLLGGQR